jgi:membrane fusion protein, multidrug efflux system
MLKISKSIVIIIFAAFVLAGCGSEVKESKSMEQIRDEEGVPVKVQEVKPQTFQKSLSFYAHLEGIKEATKASIVGGRIEKVLAKVGDRVEKDQVILKFAEDNPGVQFEQARTGFENAEKTYNRMKVLLEAGETSQAAFDGAEANYLVSKRNFESSRQMLHMQAPFSGVVVDIKINEGDNVRSDIPLFTVAQVNRMRAKVWANEEEISLIKKGMKAYMELNGKQLNGTVTEISMAIDPMKRAFYAVVEFDNPGLILKSGMTADIKILVYNNPKAIVIPRNIVGRDGSGMFVFLENNNTAVKRYVTNGTDEGINFEISGGIKTGDRLITQGNALLSDGIKVKVIQ